MGEAGNTSDQEFLLKEEKLLLWVSFLPFLWGIYIALTAINKCGTLCHVEETDVGNIDDVGRKQTSLSSSGVLATD